MISDSTKLNNNHVDGPSSTEETRATDNGYSTPIETPPPPPSNPNKAVEKEKRSKLRWMIYAFFGFILLAGLVGFYGLYWLSNNVYRSASLEKRFNEAVVGNLPKSLAFSSQDVGLTYDGLRGLVIEVEMPRLASDLINFVGESETISVAISLYDIFFGQLNLTEIEVIAPQIAVRAGEGFGPVGSEFSTELLSITQSDGPLSQVGESFLKLHDGVDALLRLAQNRGLERITFIDGEVSYSANNSSMTREYSDIRATIAIINKQKGVALAASGVGRGGAWQFTSTATPVESGRGHEINTQIDDLTVSEVIPALGRKDFSIRTNAALSLSVRSKFVDDNKVPTASVEAKIGSAYVNLGDNDIALLDNGSVFLIWSPELKAISVDEAIFNFGPTSIPFTGYIRPSPNNPLTEIDFRLVARDAVFAPRDVLAAEPINADLVGVNARFDFVSKYLTVNLFEVRVGEGSIVGAINTNLQNKFPSLAGAISINNLSAQTFKQIWPPTIAGGARRWFVNNVEEGLLTKGELTLAVPPGLIGRRDPNKLFPRSAFKGEIAFQNATIRTFGDVPKLFAPNGTVAADEEGLSAFFENGEMTSASGLPVEVPSGIFKMPSIGPLNPDVSISVSMLGEAKALAEIANAKPLQYMEQQDIPPSAVEGQGVAEISAKFKLRPEIDRKNVSTEATIRLRNFSSSVPIEGREITNGDVVVEINKLGTSIRGTTRLDGLDANIDLFLAADGSGDGSRTDIQMVLNEAQRQKLGIDLGSLLVGSTPIEVGEVDQKGRRPISVNLTGAKLSLSAIGWSKGAGVPARMEFLLVDNGKRQLLENIVIFGEGFSAKGRAEVSTANGLEKLSLSQISLNRNDSAAVEVERTGKNRYSIIVNGDRLDARGLIRTVKTSLNSNEASEPYIYSISGSVGSLTGFGDQALSNANFTTVIENGFPSSLQLRATQSQGQQLSAKIEEGTGSLWLTLSAQNGGALLAFIDLTYGVQGGNLSLSASLGQSRRATIGQAFLSNFTLGGSENLDRLADSVQRERSATNRLFEQARTDFSLKNGLLVLDDAYLRGPAIGITLNGSVDTVKESLNINGVYVPAYGLNNAFSRIPVIGPILGGKRNQGLLGVTFRVKGKLQGPILTINPLSAIAPGVFRRIFEFR